MRVGDLDFIEQVSLPDNLPILYKHYVSDLVETLTSEKIIGRAVDEVRELIERIEVSYDVDTKKHTMMIVGNIVELLGKSNLSGADDYQQAESSIKLVAGVGFEPTTFRL